MNKFSEKVLKLLADHEAFLSRPNLPVELG